MNRLIFVLSISLLIYISKHAGAEEVGRYSYITKVHPVSSERINIPATREIMRFYIDAVDWGTANCANDTVDVKQTDKNLISVLLIAFSTSKRVRFFVDDRIKIFDDTCLVTGAIIEK